MRVNGIRFVVEVVSVLGSLISARQLSVRYTTLRGNTFKLTCMADRDVETLA